jgi:DNA-binding NtrC family response regulator
MVRVLVVDDEPMHLRHAAEAVRGAGFEAVLAESGAAALEMLRSDAGIGVVLLDLVMPDLDGMAVMEAMNREAIGVPVIVQTGNSAHQVIISAMRQGAADFFVKPVSPERLAISLRNALKLKALEGLVRAQGNRRGGSTSLADLVAASPAMARVTGLVQKAAKSPLPILIEGEHGTGKELVARAIAGMGERARKPFVTVNCGAVALDAIEAVLFGRGDGAGAESAGKFKQANTGTLYLDEVAELPLDVQEKLLRAMETGRFVPVGAGKPERANVRIIAASNRRLLHVAKAGGFREDLYYRLHVMPIYIPPLRERREEIAALASHFATQVAAETGKCVTGLTGEALALLESYDWPGNIGQLEAAVCRAVAMARAGMLEAADFPQILAQAAGRDEALAAIMALPVEGGPTHIDVAPARHRDAAIVTPERFLDSNGGVTALADLERALIAFAIEHHEGRMSRVARALKIGRSTLYRKLREYGLEDQIEREVA